MRSRRTLLALPLLCLVSLGCPGPRDVIYPAPPARDIEPLGAGRSLGFEVPEVGRGVALHHPAPPGAPTLVFFHGNGDQVAHLTGLGLEIERRGLGFLAVEYPGYGPVSEGSPSEASIYATGDAALARLRGALETPAASTIVMGQSLGTGVAVEMARRGHAAGVVLMSPFTSIPDVAATKLSGLVRIVLADAYDTRSKAPQISMPVLIAHGARDTLIPVSMARELDAAFPRSELVVFDSAGHNDLWQAGGRRWLDRVAAFCRATQRSARGAVDAAP